MSEDSVIDKYREEAKEVAAAAHGAARDDKDARHDELFSRLLTLYEKLNEVIRQHMADEGQKVLELKEGLARVELKVDGFVAAFPAGDAVLHRLAHEAQIKDEVEENLWQADEFEDLKKEVAAKFEEAKNTFQPTRNDFDESLFKPLDSNDTVEWKEADELFNQDSTFSSFETPLSSPAASVDMDQVRSEMEQMVKKYVKEYMDELFQKNTEKVAWEVIPDLAENLIRQELSKISNKIINDG